MSNKFCISDFISKVYVVEERRNPSTDYFVLPAVSSYRRQIIFCGFNDTPSSEDIKGAMIVFVRYIPSTWMKLINKTRDLIARLVLFVDDDVLTIGATAGLPLRYRYKLARLVALRRRWLQHQNVELWVSTTNLQHKYAALSPRLVFPTPIVANNNNIVRVFYHGSSSHFAEIKWLRFVMDKILCQDEKIVFEIIGGKDVYSLFRDIPQVIVVHPMRWIVYRKFISMPGRHVGLAPSLNVPFNRFRSYTKFFDITLCGAVGVYAADSIYTDVVSHGVDGLLVSQDPSAWVDAIMYLVQNAPLREIMLENAQKKLLALTAEAQQNYEALHKY